ncbi:Spore germination protein B2 [Bacillus sp. THAF10]|uniref:GerAB/ArcD/ProY family transporter n=1 Tax=Bacillus sp. THAF10 TaxID=2587848 RepID=UPI001269005D|nr:GerAB/ArcD/ProY family transporter [Bacillus sp. THAF10]QFT89669.1 Spore germination protein B2 [Bacillus sp. THAF10]
MKEKLHPFQIAILIYMIQSGVTLFSVPRLAAEAFGTNGWLGILPISLIVTIIILVIGLIFKWGKGQSIFTILEGVVPRWILTPLYLLIACNFTILAILVTKKYILLLKMLFFQDTPSLVFIFMFFILSYLLLSGDIYQIGKATVILFFFTIWTMLLLTAHLTEFSFVRMTSFFFQGDKDLLKGGLNIFSAFLGFELSLFLFPYVEKPYTKALLIGNGITTFIYLSVSFVCFGFFSFEYIVKDLYPVITLIEYVKFPFIERVENLIFSLFALKVLITVVMYLWAGKELIQHSFPRLKPNFIVLSMLTFGYLVSYIPKVIREVDQWLLWFTYIETGVVFFLPILLLFLLAVNKLLRKGMV